MATPKSDKRPKGLSMSKSAPFFFRKEGSQHPPTPSMRWPSPKGKTGKHSVPRHIRRNNRHSRSKDFLKTRRFPKLVPLPSTTTQYQVVVVEGGPIIKPKRRRRPLPVNRDINQYFGLPRTNPADEAKFNPELTRSCIDDIHILSDFCSSLIENKRKLLESQRPAQDDNIEAALEKAATDKKKAVLDRALTKIRTAAEKLKTSGNVDLRGFSGDPLSPEEFQERMKSQFQVRLTNKEVNAVVAHFDRDGDGHIDYMEIHLQMFHPERLRLLQTEGEDRDEFLYAMDKIRIKAGPKMNLRKVFEKFDEDGSGSIDREEFRAALKQMCPDLENRELHAVYNRLDPNGDGSIKYDEFAWAYFNRRNKKLKKKHIWQTEKTKTKTKPVFRPAGAKSRTRRNKKKQKDGNSDPYMDAQRREYLEDQMKKDRWISKKGFSRTSISEASKDIQAAYYLHSEDASILKAEKEFIKERAERNLHSFKKRHRKSVQLGNINF